jgi:hypothetical protein
MPDRLLAERIVKIFQVTTPSPSATAAALTTAVAVFVNRLQEADLSRGAVEPLTSLYELVTLQLDQMLQDVRESA